MFRSLYDKHSNKAPVCHTFSACDPLLYCIVMCYNLTGSVIMLYAIIDVVTSDIQFTVYIQYVQSVILT